MQFTAACCSVESTDLQASFSSVQFVAAYLAGLLILEAQVRVLPGPSTSLQNHVFCVCRLRASVGTLSPAVIAARWPSPIEIPCSSRSRPQLGDARAGCAYEMTYTLRRRQLRIGSV